MCELRVSAVKSLNSRLALMNRNLTDMAIKVSHIKRLNLEIYSNKGITLRPKRQCWVLTIRIYSLDST